MFRMWKMGLVGLGMTAALALAGCASTGDAGAKPASAVAPSAQAAAPSTQAVACSKCQVTYIQVPTNDSKGRFYGYSNRRDMECPDCKTAVETFFQTGTLKHQCTHCQGNMEVCEGHT
jgi:hypothetical protein